MLTNTSANKLQVKVERNELTFYNPSEPNDKVTLSFHRTLRIPDDGKVYPLPPSLGTFPIKRVDDYLNKVPKEWVSKGGVFLPLFQREAMWISFKNPTREYPHALKIAAGKVNALSGEMWDEEIKKRNKQDYCVTPLQPWLDGINSGNGIIKQFVAMQLGEGYTIEGQVTGEENVGGVQVICYRPKESERLKKFPKITAPLMKKECEKMSKKKMCLSSSSSLNAPRCRSAKSEAKELGIAAGGRIKQDIVKDAFGEEFWDVDSKARIFIHIVNSEMYRQITGENPPNTPVSAQTYSSYNYPWFDWYNENIETITKSEILENVKSVSEIDQEKYGVSLQNNTTVKINNVKVIKDNYNPNNVRDGDW